MCLFINILFGSVTAVFLKQGSGKLRVQNTVWGSVFWVVSQRQVL